MFIEKLFSPKWKHKKPSVRREALQALNPQKQETQKIFAEVIKVDADMSIRRYVVRRLADLDVLYEIWKNDPGLAEEAKKSICQLIAGNAQIKLNYDDRVNKFSEIDEQFMIEFIAKEAKEAELRKIAVEKIQRQSLLGDLAVNDSDQDVRLAALNGITQLSTLERVFKNSRTKDKRVSSIAQQRLNAVKAEQEKPLLLRKEAKQRCLELETLLQNSKKNGNWGEAEANFQRLNQAWDNIIDQWQDDYGELGDELTKWFARLTDEFKQWHSAKQQEHAEQLALEEKAEPFKAQKRRVCEKFQEKIAELQQLSGPDLQTATDLTEFINQCNEQWNVAEDELRKDKASYEQSIKGHEELNNQYYKLFSNINNYKNDLNVYLENTNELNALLEKTKQMLDSEELLEQGALNVLVSHRKKLGKTTLFLVEESLLSQVKHNLERIQDKIDSQVQRTQHDVKEFFQIVTDMEAALKSGKTKHAVNMCNRGKKILRSIPVIERKKLQQKNYIKRFNDGLAQLEELQSWRQWSSAPIKEKLYKEMEQLAQETESNPNKLDLDYHDVAQRVRAAREEWKKLTAAETNPSKELWEMFDSACSRAYAPCQEYFSHQADERTENLHKREAACASLEEYLQVLSHKPSDLIDWKALDKIIRVAQDEWRNLGVVNRKDKDVINKRFRNVVNALRKILLDKKQTNKEEKETLIRRAETISKQLQDENTTLKEAIHSIKQLQAEWKNIGVSVKDGELWKSFRRVCDEIFVRREQEKAEVEQHRQQSIDNQTAVCESIEKLAKLEGSELKAAQKKLEELKKQWAALPRSPKQTALDKRYQQACHSFDEQNLREQKQQRRRLLETQQQRMELCLKAEVSLINCLNQQESLQICKQFMQELQHQWQTLPEHEDSISKSLLQRFTTVTELLTNCEQSGIESVKNQIDQTVQDRIAEKESLCLQIEVLANIDSPPNAKQARMEYQISQLAEQMKQSDSINTCDQIEEIQCKWHLTGMVDDPANQALEQRFKTALNAAQTDL